MRRLTQKVFILALVPLAGWAQTATGTYFLAGAKAAAVVDAEKLELRYAFETDQRISAIQSDAKQGILYVLQNGSRSLDGVEQDTDGEIVVTNLAAKTQTKHPAGRRAFLLAPGQDGKLMVCAAAGFAGAKKDPRVAGQVTAFRADTGALAGRWDTGRLVATAAANRNRVYVITAPERVAKDSPLEKPTLLVFEAGKEKAVYDAPIDPVPDSLYFSKDGTLLYALRSGAPPEGWGKWQDAVLSVYETDTLTLRRSHAAGYLPVHQGIAPDGTLSILSRRSSKDKSGQFLRYQDGEALAPIGAPEEPHRLVRLPGLAGRIIVGARALAFLPDDPGKGEAWTVPFKSVPHSTRVAPLEMIYLPAQNKIFALTGLDQVAFFDLAQKQVTETAATGRSGAKFKRMMAASLAANLMTGMNQIQGHMSGNPYSYQRYGMGDFLPRLASQTLAAAPDGETVFALNAISEDITVIKTADGSVGEKIPVAGAGRLFGFAGQQLFAVSGETGGQWFDTAKAKLSGPIEGVVTASVLDPGRGRLIVLTTRGALVRDGHRDEPLRRIAGTEGMSVVFWPEQ